jgi:hypothetical protein
LIRRFTDLIWPTLERPKQATRTLLEEEERRDVEAIESLTFPGDIPTAVTEEAQRLHREEDDRRRGADARASTYLLVVGALVPLLTYLEGTVWGQSFGPAPRWLSLVVLGLAVLYLIGAGRWALHTLRVGAYHRVDVGDVVKATQIPETSSLTLLKQGLIATRRNRGPVNDKISGIIMAHLFLGRAVTWFGALLLLQVFWYLGREGWSASGPALKALMCAS